MTTKNYTTMTSDELVKLIKDANLKSRGIRNALQSRFPGILDELVKRTSFLQKDESVVARIYCLEHGIYEPPTCHGVPNGMKCNNHVKWYWKNGRFNEFCSSKCAHSVPETYQKTQRTCEERYGCSNPGQTEEAKKKRENTNLARYGVKNVYQSEEIKERIRQTNETRYGVSHPMQSQEIKERLRQSVLNTHGVEHVTQLDSVKEKIKETCMRRLGVEHPAQSPIVQEKMRNTCQERYNVDHAIESEEVREKIHETCQRRFGTNTPLESREIWEKTKQSLLANHGVECTWKSPEIREKARETLMAKLGVDNSMKCPEVRRKARQTIMRKLGVEYPTQSPKILEKTKQTNMSRHGVEWYSQSPEFHRNKRHRYTSEKYSGLTFDSSWEVKVYEFCKDNNIPIEYSPEISYKYEYDGRNWTYHPDFLINGKVYEVKGDYFFRINESTGKEEMFCPYRDPCWSDEEYDYQCGIYEAKHRCMLANSVTILREREIKNLDVCMFPQMVNSGEEKPCRSETEIPS